VCSITGQPHPSAGLLNLSALADRAANQRQAHSYLQADPSTLDSQDAAVLFDNCDYRHVPPCPLAQHGEQSNVERLMNDD
jgi:hypothetical protein